jgi:hypothetical protein
VQPDLSSYIGYYGLALDPDARKLDEGLRFPLCRPDELLAQIRRAGFHDAEVTAIDVPTHFASFQDYWEPFLGGQGPAPAYAMSLDEAARVLLRDTLQERLPVQSDGSISLIARAWAVRATVSKAMPGAGLESVRPHGPILCQRKGPACSRRITELSMRSVRFGRRRPVAIHVRCNCSI